METLPLFSAALVHPVEGKKLLTHFSTLMPPAVCNTVWAAVQAPYIPGSHTANALALFNGIGGNPSMRDEVALRMATGLQSNHLAAMPQASNFYNAIIADNTLWQAPLLRDQNGPWTTGIRSLTNMRADVTDLSSFFDGWSGGPAALTACTAPDYKFDIIYDHDPTTVLADMGAEATLTEIKSVLVDMHELSGMELAGMMEEIGIDRVHMEPYFGFASSGDSVKLSEHHIYGSSHLGVQRYDSTTLANIYNLPEDESAGLSTRLNQLKPWYSYAFDDIIKSDKLTPYVAAATMIDGNTYFGELNVDRTLGRRYYEMTDHLGNVLATVLDRKTGVGEDGTPPIGGWGALRPLGGRHCLHGRLLPRWYDDAGTQLGICME